MIHVWCRGQWYMETYYTPHAASTKHTPTSAHLAKGAEMLQARVEKVARGQGGVNSKSKL